MVWAERGGLRDVVEGFIDALSRNRKDEVEIEALEARAMGESDGFAGVLGAVDAPEKLQPRLIE